jgi:predicted metal-dependent peptidase
LKRRKKMLAQNEYTKARAKLIIDQPFFGTLCMRLKPVETTKLDTGATDGVSLLYNPNWFLKLNQWERVGFLAHEVMHCVFMHMLRRQKRQHKKWNIACDYNININLEDIGFQLPPGGLIDEKYRGMSADHIYTMLPPQDEDDGGSLDPGGCGGVLDHPDVANGPTPRQETEWTVAISSAANEAKSRGMLPGNIESLIETILTPQVDWKAVLARFLRVSDKSDYSWVRFNRRFIAQGLYLPGLHSPALGEISIIVDTSGSVSDNELQVFSSETSAILQDLNPSAINFVQCDAEVHSAVTYTREDLPLTYEYKGRGGTSFVPGIEYVQENYPLTTACIYFTDLEGDFPDEVPEFPVLWVTTVQHSAPFGEVIYMDQVLEEAAYEN